MQIMHMPFFRSDYLKKTSTLYWLTINHYAQFTMLVVSILKALIYLSIYNLTFHLSDLVVWVITKVKAIKDMHGYLSLAPRCRVSDNVDELSHFEFAFAIAMLTEFFGTSFFYLFLKIFIKFAHIYINWKIFVCF